MFRITRPGILSGLVLCALLLPAAAGAFELTSNDVSEGTRVPDANVFNGFGCTGGNASPALAWSGAPDGTRSFALSVYDPDAPTGSGFWHWVVLDIPATASDLAAGVGMSGVVQLDGGARQLRSDYGFVGYGGPCPPEGHGMHRYIFTLHALDIDKVPVPDDATAAVAGFVVNAHTLATAKLTAVYWR